MGFGSFDFQGGGVGTSSGEYEFNCGVSSSRSGSGAGSRGGSGRQKPRLVKVRRAVNSSRNGMKNPEPGFNPFKLNSERLDKSGYSRRVDFVFGAGNSLQDLISNYSGVGVVEKDDTCNEIYDSNVGGRNESLGLDQSEEGRNEGVSVSEDKIRYKYDPDGDISDGVTDSNLRFRDSVVGVDGGDQAWERDVKVGQESSSVVFNGIETGKVSSGKLDDGGFVFGAGVSDSVANSSREGIAGPSTVSEFPFAGKCVGSSVKVEENTEVTFHRDVKQDVTFGDTVSDSAGNITLEREDFADDVRENNFVYGECESRKADDINFNVGSGETLNLEKGQRQGVFVFGSANEPNNPSLGSPSAQISDPMGCALYDDGAHVKDRVETASSAETYSKVDLPFEFKKLHIKTPKDATPTDTSEDFDASKHAGADGLFMFTSSSEDRASSTEKPTASQEQSNETDSLGKKNIFIFGSCKNTFGSSSPNVKAVAENIVKDLNSNTEERVQFGSGVSFDGSGSSDMDSRNPFFSTPLSFSVDLSHGLNRKGESSVKSRFSKKHKSKNARQKLAQLNLDMGQCSKEPISSKSNSEEPGDSPRCYSPMDVSPRGNIGTERPAVEETSAPSNGFPFMDRTPTDAQCATAYVAKEDELSAAHLQPTAFCMSSTAGGTSEETEFSNSSNIPARDDEGRTQFCSSDLAGGHDKLFAFTASTSDQAQATLVRRQGKKYRRKIAHVSRAVSSTCDQPLNINLLSNGLHDGNEQNPALKSEEPQRSEASLEKGNLSELTSAEKACDKWRLRGNQTYKAGEMSQAEDLYTWGINCVPSLEMPGLNVKPLVLCYNNRAAARMGLGKVRDALGDCLLAISCDPEFHKARIRAGNCHLMLGEVELAMQHFNRILAANGVCLDRQIMFAASEGMQKGQKVMSHMSRSADLIKIKTSEAATEALNLITEAL
ncbi:DnaJ homolog subfamily C member 7-like protein, partial [Drosera capensis]